jgi:hypothetical protein
MNPLKLEERGEHRLLKLLAKTERYCEFERRVISSFRWFQIPITWTRKELREFYYQRGGK